MIKIAGIRTFRSVPAGYLGVSTTGILQTAKAVMCKFGGDEIWLPRKSLVQVGSDMWAPEWAIKNALAYAARNPREMRRQDNAQA